MFFEKDSKIPHKNFEDYLYLEFKKMFYKKSNKPDFSIKNFPFLYDLDKTLFDFDFVLENKHRYNLNRAFLQTSSVLHHIFENINSGIINKELDILKNKLKKEHCDNNGDCNFQINCLFDDIRKWEEEQEKWLYTRAKIFKYLSRLVMGIDIVISVILIILISKYGHIGESFFSNIFLVGLVFVMMVLIKVFLDRFFIIPKVEKFGRNLYKKFVLKIRNNIISIVSLFLFLNWANKNYGSLKTLQKLQVYWKKTKK